MSAIFGDAFESFNYVNYIESLRRYLRVSSESTEDTEGILDEFNTFGYLLSYVKYKGIFDVLRLYAQVLKIARYLRCTNYMRKRSLINSSSNAFKW